MSTTTNIEKFAKEQLVCNGVCGLKVGDSVRWVNDYGIEWEHNIIGFNYDSVLAGYGRVVYIDSDAYWFPIKLESIISVNGVRFKSDKCLSENCR